MLSGAEKPDPSRHSPWAPLQGVEVVCRPSYQEVQGQHGARLLPDLAPEGTRETEPCLQADWAGPAADSAQQQTLLQPHVGGHPEAAQCPACLLVAKSGYWLLPRPQQVGGCQTTPVCGLENLQAPGTTWQFPLLPAKKSLYSGGKDPGITASFHDAVPLVL